MSEQITALKKTIYSLKTFNDVVDTSFSQLVVPSLNEKPVQPDMTVPQFFNEYDILFYSIPLSGSDDSHLALATRSLEYLDISLEDLQNEITDLREENINLKNQIILTDQINLGT